jgi:hypothetical protein
MPKLAIKDDGHIMSAEAKLGGAVHLMEDKVFMHLNDAEEKDSHQWVLNTRATNHMTGCRSTFSDLDHNVHKTFRFGDGSVVQIEGLGMVLFNCKNGEHHAFVGIYNILKLNTNIISMGQLDEIGLYVLHVEIATPVCLAMRESKDVWLWHARYRHLNFSALCKLVREEMVCRLPKVEHVDQVYGGCLAGKHRRASFPCQGQYRAEEILELVHGDLCGPISPATPSGSHYFMLLVDDCS